MFNSLHGKVSGKAPQKLFIDTNGIEWEVNVPENTLEEFPAVGEDARVFVWLQHTDALMCLYGFASASERELFFDLLKVDGIGPKGALKIMGNIACGELARVLDSGDIETLQKVPGVGKKTAAKMLLQLKGKLNLEENSAAPAAKKSAFSAVVDALADMGYERKAAEEVVQRLSDSYKGSGSFEAKSASEKEDFIFRSAIVELAK